MSYDALSLSVLVTEFNSTLTNGKINKVFQPEKDEVLLNIFNKTNYKLLISCNANVNRIHFTDYSTENPTNAPAFCMLLRKYIVGGTIISVTQQPFERVVDITIETKNELGYLKTVHLIFELTGRDSNMILTDENYKIFDSIRRFSCDLTSSRIVLAGATYKFFEPQQKVTPIQYDKIDFLAKTFKGEAKDFVLQNILGVSTVTAEEIACLANYDLSNIANATKTFVEKLQTPNPNVIYNNDIPLDVFPVEYTCKKGKKVYFDTLNKAHDSFYYLKNKTQRFGEKAKSIHTLVKNAINRTEKKLGLQKQAYLEATQSQTNKTYGDLILSNLYLIKKLDESLTAVDYSAPDYPTVTIPLDRSLTPQQNAQAYYKKYAKQKSSAKYNEKLIEENTQLLEYLKTVATSLKFSNEATDLTEITEELTSQGIIKAKKDLTKKKNGKEEAKKTKPLTYDIDGFTVLVGKNNIQNDTVTFKMSQPNDFWLHTQSVHSSHALVLNPNNLTELPEIVIFKTAQIVAFYSQANQGTKIAVDYCNKKYVKKPSQAKPGFVVYTNFKTMIVDPNQHLDLLKLS